MHYSIIVPTYNRLPRITQCLEALGRLTYARERFEVIVVDDGGRVPLDAALEPFASRLTLKLLRVPQGGPARARNAGLAAASGDFVVFTDDDCQPLPGWLEAYDDVFRRSPAAAVGGEILDSPENNLYGRTSQLLVRYLYEYGATKDSLPRFFCSNNLAFPRRELLEMGGFDEGFPLAAGEDRDVCDRWPGRDGLVFAPSAAVLHRQDLTLRQFVAQHFRYGRGGLHFAARRVKRGQEPARIAPLAFYTGMLSAPLRTFRGRERLLGLWLMVLSQAANLAGFVAEKGSRGSARPASAEVSPGMLPARRP